MCPLRAVRAVVHGDQRLGVGQIVRVSPLARLWPWGSAAIVRFLERHQVIDVEVARIGEDAAGIGIVPLSGNDAALSGTQRDGHAAFGDQPSCRVS